ncbi:MAG: polysaccharide deacetylase family protein [Sporolactobacillus sp.]
MIFLYIVCTIILLLIAAFLVYAIIPTLLMRGFCFRGYQAMHRGKDPLYVSLTFDDGPNPLYTPQVLDLLNRYHISATFFVVGVRARKYPELLRRMKREGHLIAIHHYNHVSNWFLTPRGSRKQCEKARETVMAITGERPVYYRPPWGHLHLFISQATKGFHMVLWSAILGDWRRALSTERLKTRIDSHLRDGAVICLHDDGENPGANDDAPGNTIAALEEVLPEAVQAYTFVTIDQLYQIKQQQSY